MERRHFLRIGPAALGAGLLGAAPLMARATQAPKTIRLDYAYYSPPSLVLRKFGWLEEALKPQGTDVKWVLSQGSNRALEYLNSDSVDFGSTAGLAALLARANGNPIKAVYVYSRPEWTALAVSRDSPIKSVRELKGKKVAATKGTDPYLFLLRALHENGLQKSDVEIVHLQHPDGRVALEQGRVDAWAGLDPHLAASELEAGSRLIYRNVNFNTYGFLNVSDAFAARHPDQVKRVIAAYEQARAWIAAHPEDTVKLLAEESKLSPDVARLQLKRNDFSHPQIGREHIDALRAAAPILTEEDLVKSGTDLPRTINALIDPSYAQGVVKA
ncbi:MULTISPECIES: aliphatic sulfonate ABC transporter substrate-binding protein [unclassified Herbaspirillum]|uniref:aliphatic sulfonate ABC transporter substrate-binding protein n=1 Tax=unclassified Herbaspirillum TaxID=2624150 RepID=UPI001150CB57|nr:MULTISPECIES: aliphatic sulfonate ABC transporter substrate-binding protein [unclassified Herbaspirillum]MBB5392386.1 sulfonate transport system substrate-binding protein [Herbaspirillum sp. SJZ102]TQK06027.1 sulfonate transport system substrate-binding protein [Herbaspirillum sp. SJZ130]TQK12495.1 sulfonate transport system substrate-binding protein [Herbaspirillum sp. SJZ106]